MGMKKWVPMVSRHDLRIGNKNTPSLRIVQLRPLMRDHLNKCLVWFGSDVHKVFTDRRNMETYQAVWKMMFLDQHSSKLIKLGIFVGQDTL